MLVDKKIKFRNNGKLKILQVSDAQDMHIVRPEMVRMLNDIYDREKPDLVVFTGDNILGNHMEDAVVGSRHPKRSYEFVEHRVRTSLSHILDPLELRGIPFTMTYGNHDDRNQLGQRKQAEIWMEYSRFFGLNERDDVPIDTFNVPIYDRTGEKIVYNLWLMDSAGLREDGTGYEGVQPESLAWYKQRAAELKAQNGGVPVRSLMFQHIPFPEMAELYLPCEEGEAGAIPSHKGWYRLDPEKAHGISHEFEYLDTDCGQLDVLRETGDVDAVVSGHLHTNAFEGTVQGQRVIACPGASFRSYGLPDTRGVCLFTLDESDPSAFEYRFIHYFDVYGKNIASKTRYFLNGDECETKKYAAMGAAVLTAAVGAAAAVCAKKLRRK